MAFFPFRKIRITPTDTPTSKQINDIQDNIGNAIQQLLGKDQLDSAIIKNVSLAAGVTNSVAHKLGRPLTGWIIIRNHGGYAVGITDLQDTNKSPQLYLQLTTPAPCVVDLLVF